MVEKTFRIISNSREMLTAEAISLALMQNISLDLAKPDAAFAVIETSKSCLKSDTSKADLVGKPHAK